MGYRVRSTSCTQFRLWATRTLRECLQKDLLMDDARFKEPRWGAMSCSSAFATYGPRRSAQAIAAHTLELAMLERLEKRLSSEKRNVDPLRVVNMRAPEEEGNAL
ncbi:hypothetical protein D3C77_220670 [compost metagenome]